MHQVPDRKKTGTQKDQYKNTGTKEPGRKPVRFTPPALAACELTLCRML